MIWNRTVSNARNSRTSIFPTCAERTIPEKPNSRLQKYRLTDKGRKQIS